MNKNEYNIDTLILEIDEENGIVGEYQRQLYEASLMGIDKVLLTCAFQDVEDEERCRADDLILKIKKTCKVLKMTPLVFEVFYIHRIYNEPMIGKTNDKVEIESLYYDKLVSFDEYKNKRKNLLENRKPIGKVLAKHITDWYK